MPSSARQRVGGESRQAVGRARTQQAPPSSVFIRLLSCVVEVASNCATVRRIVTALYRSAMNRASESAVVPTVHFAILADGQAGAGPTYRICGEGVTAGPFASAADAVVHLESMITMAAAVSLADHVLVHAGVVASPAGGIVIPGASGAGKSTLVAALCFSGFRYLSDELAVIDRESLALHPFVKPMCLKDGGWSALAAAYARPPAVLSGTRAEGEAVHFLLPPKVCEADGQTRIRYVLRPERQPGASARLVRSARAQTLMDLAQHSLNLPRHGPAGVDLLARVVEGAECYTLIYDDLACAVATIQNFTGA